MRERRTLTRANSAATKKPLRSTSASTASRPRPGEIMPSSRPGAHGQGCDQGATADEAWCDDAPLQAGGHVAPDAGHRPGGHSAGYGSVKTHNAPRPERGHDTAL